MTNKNLKKKKLSKNAINESHIKTENSSSIKDLKKEVPPEKEVHPGQCEAPRRKKKKKDIVTKSVETQDELDPIKPQIKVQESKRRRKRKLNENLMQEKSLQSEIKMQEKGLNYLSMWKHSRSEWKFHKINQIWLFKNLYDDTKIPNEYWKTTLDYFNSAQGRIRNEILDKAKKVIDQQEEDTSKNEESDNEVTIKKEKDDLIFQRARDVLQYISE